MRPDQEKLGKRAGAKQKVRRLLDVRLAWMRGYPCGSGAKNGVRLRTWPRAGHATDPTDRDVTPQDLSKAVTLRLKLMREFPRALPAVVGDKQRWNARMEATLATLKGVLAGKQSLPDFEQLLEARLLRDRERRELAHLATETPKLIPLLNALLWSQAEDKDIADCLAVLRKFTAELATISAGGELLCAIDLVELGRSVGVRHLGPLVEFLAHPHNSSALLLTRDQRQAQVEQVRSFWRMATATDNASLPWFMPSNEPCAFEQGQRWLQDLLQTPEKERAPMLALLGDLLPTELLTPWRTYSHDVHHELESLRRALTHWHRNHESLAWRRFRDRSDSSLVALIKRQPPQIAMGRIRRDLAQLLERCSGTRAEQIRTLHKAIRKLPYTHDGIALRCALMRHWAEGTGTYGGDGFEAHLPEFARYLASVKNIENELEPWLRAFRDGPFLGDWWAGPEQALLGIRRGSEPKRGLQALRELCRVAGPALRGAPEDHLDVFFEVLRGEGQAHAIAVHIALLQAQEAEVLLECDHQLVRTAWRMSGEEPERFVSLLESMAGKEPFENHSSVLLECCQRKSLARLLGRAIELEESAAVLKFARSASALANRREELPAMPKPKTKLHSWAGFPDSLLGVLGELESATDDAPEQVARTLQGLYPGREALAEEMQAIRSKLDSATPARRAGMHKRLTSLEVRWIKPPRIGVSQLERLQQRLQRRVVRAQLERVQTLLTVRVAHSITSLLGPESAALLQADARHLEILSALKPLSKRSRQLGLRLLSGRSGPAPWDLREHPKNKTFLDQLRRSGIDPDPWLSLEVRKVQVQGRELQLGFAHDPLEVMRMGEAFQTCLALDSFNFFSAVTNAADINKRVLFLRDSRGKVHGRCLFALTNSGRLLTFHCYAHDASVGFDKLVLETATRLCQSMGTQLAAKGQVQLLVAPEWYDDGPEDLVGALEFLEDGSEFRNALCSLDGEALCDKLRGDLTARKLDATALHAIAELPELEPQHLIALAGLYSYESDPQTQIALIRRLAAVPDNRETRSTAKYLARVLATRTRTLRALHQLEAFTLADLLVESAPSLALRILRQHRSAWLSKSKHEFNPTWLFLAGEANLALRRPKRALLLYKQAEMAALVDLGDWYGIGHDRLTQRIEELARN